jgi:hypothetical protein
MNTSEALSFCCGCRCLQLDSIQNKLMVPLKIHTSQNPPTTSNKNIKIYTWMVEKAHWFTLFKHWGTTFVYSHYNDVLYFAAPCVQLHPNLPDGYAFLAQTALDIDQPRLLIVDIIQVPDSQQPLPNDPLARGNILRSLHMFFSAATCHIQWSGEYTSLMAFLQANKLPHKVQAVLELQEDPLQMLYIRYAS